jgi:hypothetical protein
MNVLRRKTIQCTLALSLLWVLVGGAVAPAGAKLPAQEPMQPFKKPAWGLTMACPAGWQVSTDEANMFALQSADADDAAGLVMARDPAWRDRNYPLEDLLIDLTGRIGMTLENQTLEPVEAGRISGATARANVFAATETSSGRDIKGYVVAFARGSQGYGIVIGSRVETFEGHSQELSAVLESIRFAAAPGPSATPTARRPTSTPRKPTSTPTPRKPTATPTLIPTPESVSLLTTGREAYDLALPVAERWNERATLGKIECTSAAGWQGDDVGRCDTWALYFADSQNHWTDTTSLRIVVNQGQVSDSDSGEVDVMLPALFGDSQWMDSPEAVQSFLDNGGADFLARHPVEGAILSVDMPRGRTTGLVLEQLIADSDPMWTISASSRTDEVKRDVWWVRPNAVTGQIDTSLYPTETIPSRYLTARRAFALAQKPAGQWQADAQLMEAIGSINADDRMFNSGQLADWLFRFVSASSDKVCSIHVTNGRVDGSCTELDLPRTEPVIGEWFDSSIALKGFKTNPEYAAFKERFPTHGYDFWLRGGSEVGYHWWVAALTKGAGLGSYVPAAAAAPTQTPTRTATRAPRTVTVTPTAAAAVTSTLEWQNPSEPGLWCILSGTVYDSTAVAGHELAGVEVSYSCVSIVPGHCGSARDAGTTGRDGKFKFGVFIKMPDHVRITATKPGFEKDEVTLDAIEAHSEGAGLKLVLRPRPTGTPMKKAMATATATLTITSTNTVTR